MRFISTEKHEDGNLVLNMGLISSRKHDMEIWKFLMKGTYTIERYVHFKIKELKQLKAISSSS